MVVQRTYVRTKHAAHSRTRSAGPEDGGTRQARRLEGIMRKWGFGFQNETFDFANGVLIFKMRLLISQMGFWF